MTTLEIQRRLKALGFDPGPVDGVRGRLTIRAIKAFQATNGLATDGIVAARTEAAFRRVAAALPLPQTPSPQVGGVPVAILAPWYEEALRLKGIREAAGAADNPTILGWARRLRLVYRKDSIPWCGLFAGHCVAVALPDEPLPTNPLGARNWQKFGVAAEPTLGAVLVFWRGSRSGAQGHVGFYAGEDASAFHVLGGNQSDSVSIARVARSRLLATRWPATAPGPLGGAIKRVAADALSTNEA